MEPVSIVVVALVKLLVSAAQPVADRAAMDAYEALKGTLLRKYGAPTVSATIQELEKTPQSPGIQGALTQQLRAVGADHDPEILALSNQLARLVDGLLGPSDAMEGVQRRAGGRAMGHVLEGHIARVMDVRGRYAVEDSDLLTGNLGRTGDVPREVLDQLTNLHASMRLIIEKISTLMEDSKYRNAEAAIGDLHLGFNERERATKLIAADKQVHVSYETLRMVVEFFSGFNKETLSRIERETSAQRESNMMLGNAIMIYELTDFVINYVEGFGVRGVSELESLHADVKQRIDKARTDQDKLTKQAQNPLIEASARAQALIDIENRRGAIDEVEQEWATYVREVGQFGSVLHEVRAKIPTLKLIRDSAKSQISVLQLVSVMRFLKESSNAFKGTVDSLQGFQLAPLTSTRVRRLIGV